MTHIFRSHSLAEIMTDPKNKGEVLSQGAKTAIRRIAKQILFGVPADAFKVDNKYVAKGLTCEGSAISLLNTVRGTRYAKNEERRTNDWISGEPDIVADDHGIDIKCSWSIDTFPLTAEEGEDKTYEWQARAYMMLFDRPRWDICYCLVDTPDNLMGYEDWRLHKVSHIPSVRRVTSVRYERDAALEEKIRVKCSHAQQYLDWLLAAQSVRYDLATELIPTASAVQTATAVPPAAKAAVAPRTMSAKQAFAPQT